MDKVKVGIIGLGSRGYGLLGTILHCEKAEVVAVCDAYQDRTDRGFDRIRERGFTHEVKKYTDYMELIHDKDVQAVVIATSWDEHTNMAVASMKAGKYTALEVSGAYDLEDCWRLVRTYEETKTPIMFMENCCFDKFEMLSTSLVRNGKLGKVVFAHGSYSHELYDEILGGNVRRHYRLNNYIKRNCDNYPTHELGPIAKIMNLNRGNKLVSLSSFATRPVMLEEIAKTDKSPDATLAGTKFNQGDIIVTTLTCANGEIITMTLDTTLPRFYSREITIRGTKGLTMQDGNIVMLDEDIDNFDAVASTKAIKTYMDSGDKYEKYLPDEWRYITEEEMELGHGGMDFIEFQVFFDAVLNNKPMPIDVYDAALWMSITPLSEQSIAQGGAVQAVPDFTRGKWVLRKPLDVLKLPIFDKDE